MMTEVEAGTPVYETIIFLDGDDYDQAMVAAGAYIGDERSVLILRGARQWAALFEHLSQWDYGEPAGETYVNPPWGTYDDTDESHDGYVVTWNAPLGYVSLVRVFPAPDGLTAMDGGL